MQFDTDGIYFEAIGRRSIDRVGRIKNGILKFHFPAEIVEPEFLQFKVHGTLRPGINEVFNYLFRMIAKPKMKRGK